MKKILVGISGASGAPIAIRLLKRLREMADVETHLIMTKGAELTIVQETDCTVEQVKLLLEASKETRIHMQMVFALLMGLSQP